MNKFFAIAFAIVALTAINSFAQGPYNTDQGQQNFIMNVLEPIIVTPDQGTVDLGDIAPGTTKEINNGQAGASNSAQFTVDAGLGWDFEVTGVLTTIDNLVELTEWQWQEDTGTWTNLGSANTDPTANGTHQVDVNTGVKLFRCAVLEAQADPYAVQGSRSFLVTFSATYMDM